MPNVTGFTPQFNRITRHDGFKVAKNGEMSKTPDNKCKNHTGRQEHLRCVPHSLQLLEIRKEERTPRQSQTDERRC